MRSRISTGMTWLAPGFSFGIGCMLIFSRWTWLEMRWNTGQVSWLVMLLFFMWGFLDKRRSTFRWVIVADLFFILLLIPLAAHGALLALPAALFREGLPWSDISLKMANVTMISGFLMTHFFAFFAKALSGRCDQAGFLPATPSRRLSRGERLREEKGANRDEQQ